MIEIKTPQEILKIKRSCALVAELLEELEKLIVPGVTTRELDEFAEDYIRRKRAIPAFKGYRNYPASICTSVNEVIVHGIPDDTKLKEGEIIGIDVGVLMDGYYGDAAKTFPVGKVQQQYLHLIQITKESLHIGIEQIKENNRIGDLSHAIQKHVERNGYNVIRDFVGHGVGIRLHEDPKIPNYGEPSTGPRLKTGMVLAIEPMVTMGSYEVEILPDQWTARTKDGSYSAHFEHTVAVTHTEALILTTT
ncbi:MAG: type I methionyl aminopeptidase [Candidatus Fischerbacteria bacterium RBG_13_37_8]|uniref:Methionine aminopeptidase n=1 Tax=Candidatus Fischerbacteria bacterium RBG_13_37_8 TaxID=1817863 RepID=A0A1F5VDY7_9BACT|nr:MAG: type I methionyl aminopeptidase [Candidatus Fischerbacteria bacterium RBG_13_37_8]